MAIDIHHEKSLGAAGVLRFRCSRCQKPTIDVPTSPPIANGKAKSHLQELNIRCVLGCVVSGLSEHGCARYMGVLSMPSLERRAYSRALDVLIPALEAAGDASCRTWLERERAAALQKATSLTSDGRVPIIVSEL